MIERTAELEGERKRTAVILDAAGEGIMLTDSHGAIEYMNPAVERLTGFTSEEAFGQNPRLWQSGIPGLAISEDVAHHYARRHLAG